MKEAYSITARELAALGKEHVPPELQSGEHLIYSSPAALAFNSPGAQGFGVKRAGLAIPGSVMLLVAPGCCGRNTAALSAPEYRDRFFYLLMDETDIVTGRHLGKIPEAVQEVCRACREKPTVVMLCITCVDALLGTDMERVCRRASEAAGVPVLPCYMYALTREGRLPPMTAVRKSVYSLLEPRAKRPDAANILGFFSPLTDDCELYALLRAAGIRQIREISRCRDFEEYRSMAEANFNLVLNPEARYAAAELETRLSIPSVELSRVCQLDKIANQYRLLGQILSTQLPDEPFRLQAEQAQARFQSRHPDTVFSLGETSNANPFELAIALLRTGFRVAELFATVSDANFPYIRRLAALSPETKIYSNLSPSMLFYDGGKNSVTVTIGSDAAYYHPEAAHLLWNEEAQPFGYRGVRLLYEQLEKTLEEKT
jgi:nitrogenase molybdenum-cofactor synthesis protein NifE